MPNTPSENMLPQPEQAQLQAAKEAESQTQTPEALSQAPQQRYESKLEGIANMIVNMLKNSPKLFAAVMAKLPGKAPGFVAEQPQSLAGQREQFGDIYKALNDGFSQLSVILYNPGGQKQVDFDGALQIIGAINQQVSAVGQPLDDNYINYVQRFFSQPGFNPPCIWRGNHFELGQAYGGYGEQYNSQPYGPQYGPGYNPQYAPFPPQYANYVPPPPQSGLGTPFSPWRLNPFRAPFVNAQQQLQNYAANNKYGRGPYGTNPVLGTIGNNRPTWA